VRVFTSAQTRFFFAGFNYSP